MTKPVVELLAVVVVLFGATYALQTQRCPRASPEELWYADYSPQLKFTVLEEMSYYFRLIFGRLEDDYLFTFIPHIKEDPEQSRNLTRKMIMAEKTALTLMGRAYDVIENSWLTLGEGSRMFLAGGKPASEVVRLMEDLLKAHVKGNELLIDAGQEVSLFFRDMLELAIEGVTQILETELDEAPEDEYGMAKLIQERIIKIAPTDLVGIIVRRFIGRSMGTVNTSPNKDAPNVLFAVLPRIEKILEDFNEMRNRELLTPESWTAFLEDVFLKSLTTTNKRVAGGQENFVLIYRNEVYLAEQYNAILDRIVVRKKYTKHGDTNCLTWNSNVTLTSPSVRIKRPYSCTGQTAWIHFQDSNEAYNVGRS